MTDVGLRDAAPFGPGQRGVEPLAPSFPQAPPLPRAEPLAPVINKEPAAVIIPPPPARAKPLVFSGDTPSGEDALSLDPALRLLAELAAHRAAATPITIGIFGGPGAGKSFALARLAARVRAITAAAAKAALGPFLPKIHVQEVNAATLEGDPALALAGQIYSGLRQPYPELARELAHAVRDPQVILRDVEERLDAARHRLDVERRALEETGSRLARLTETVLYESAGSQIDSYARAHRAGIESRLAAFGFRGDPVRNFKDFVAAANEGAGVWGLLPRVLVEFKGQMRLIVWAVILLLAGIGFDIALDTHETWLSAMRNGPAFLMPAEIWMSDHASLLALCRRAAFFTAGFLGLCNLWRAASFLRPVATGLRLMRTDLENRRRDLGSLYAHQTKRADSLAADADRLGRAAQEAERRAGGAGAHGGLLDHSPFDASAAAQAHDFFAKLGPHFGKDHAPDRLVIVLDHLEAVPAERARLILATLHRLAHAGGLVVAAAASLDHLGAARADLERWVQVPLALGAAPASAVIAQISGWAPPPLAAPIDAARSVLDDPLTEAEIQWLSKIAPFAGATPRAVKRLVNLYTLARADADVPRGLLALALAVGLGGSWAERQALGCFCEGLAFEGEESPRLTAALRDAAGIDGQTGAEQTGAGRTGAGKALARAALFQIEL